jgi:hypothetical protein
MVEVPALLTDWWHHVPMERDLANEDQEIIQRALVASVDGPFFPDGEFQTLFGLTRDEVAQMAAAWPDPLEHTPWDYESPERAQWVAVNNALNNLLSYPHGRHQELEAVVGVPLRRVAETLRRWRNDDEFNSAPRGYFDRMS